MEILALLGTPKTVTSYNSSPTLDLYDWVRSARTGSADTFNNAEGLQLDMSGWSGDNGYVELRTAIQPKASLTTLGSVDYRRVVFGWRLIFTQGFRGDISQHPRLQVEATPSNDTSRAAVSIALPITSNLALEEGQYFEVVVDYDTSEISAYVNGVYVGNALITAAIGVGIKKDAMSIFRLVFNQTDISRADYAVKGFYRDLYMGGLEDGEVFEPLGDLTITNLDTVSTTLGNGVTPELIDSWGVPGTGNVLDTAGTAVYEQVFADPTPLKSAIAITGICQRVDRPAYAQVESDGVKIADETLFTNKVRPSILRIKPSDVGDDLVVKFKIDP